MKIQIKKSTLIEKTQIGPMVIVETTTTHTMTITTELSVMTIKRKEYATNVEPSVIYSR